jgi:hypothetical protein
VVVAAAAPIVPAGAATMTGAPVQTTAAIPPSRPSTSRAPAAGVRIPGGSLLAGFGLFALAAAFLASLLLRADRRV